MVSHLIVCCYQTNTVKVFPSQRNEQLNLMRCLDPVKQMNTGDSKITVELREEDVVSFRV